jgi:choice-of-anchor B domain-containing protein
VVNYGGPDASYLNREIAFNSNEDTLTIVDVTNKSNLQMISRAVYSGSEYAHQGWLSEDHKYFFMDDELDERRSPTLINTRTRVWNVEDLDSPQYLGFINGVESTIDHNLYVKGNLIFQANYTSGLRVLRINDAQTLDMEEIAFLDTYGADNNVTFNGAWSVYPYFDSGTVIVSDRQNGLFMVRLNSVPEPGSLAMISALGLLASTFRRRRTV